MSWFSQRKGFNAARTIIQLEDMDQELRNAIWNMFLEQIVSRTGFMDLNEDSFGEIHQFSESMWSDLLKLPVDTLPEHDTSKLREIRSRFFEFEWFEVYDFIEFTSACYHQDTGLSSAINQTLEREMSGYRLVSAKIVEITNMNELMAIDAAIEQSDFEGASEHLHRALELIAHKQNPDPRNSIKESISAVESAVKEITKLPKATLEDAIKMLEKNGELHACLKSGFSKLYAYTSDKGGIRHAMLDEPNLTKADALFFLVTCSAFINYLKSKI